MSTFNPAFRSEADQEAAIALISAHGLNPNIILAEPLSADGYQTFREGQPRHLENGDPNTEEHAWPEGFPWSEFESHLTPEVLA
jgi:hypothetical protein